MSRVRTSRYSFFPIAALGNVSVRETMGLEQTQAAELLSTVSSRGGVWKKRGTGAVNLRREGGGGGHGGKTPGKVGRRTTGNGNRMEGATIITLYSL